MKNLNLPPAFEHISKNFDILHRIVLGNQTENALSEPCQEQEAPKSQNATLSNFSDPQIFMKQHRKPRTPKYTCFDLYYNQIVVAQLRLTQSQLAKWRANKGKSIKDDCIKVPKIGQHISPNMARKELGLGADYLLVLKTNINNLFVPMCNL